MKRKSSYKQFAARRYPEGKGWRYAVLLGVLILLAYVSLLFFYHRAHSGDLQSPTTFYAEKFSDWIAEHRGKSKKEKPVVKRTAAREHPAEPQIHFEFYKTLAKAEMPEVRSGKPLPKQMIADADQLERDILEAAQRVKGKS